MGPFFFASLVPVVPLLSPLLFPFKVFDFSRVFLPFNVSSLRLVIVQVARYLSQKHRLLITLLSPFPPPTVSRSMSLVFSSPIIVTPKEGWLE